MKFAPILALLATAAGGALAAPVGDANNDAPPPRCPHASTRDTDGCAASHSGATTIRPDFFTGYAAQSRQRKYRVRPDWNVAGVDYAVGFHTPLSSLKDIRLTQPPGCNLKILGGSQVLWCTGAGALEITGYRFDQAGGTWLLVDGAGYTSIDIDDCYFLNGPGTDRANGMLVLITKSDAPLTVTNSTFEGDGRNHVLGLNYLVADSRQGAQRDTIAYNAFLRAPQKALGTGPCGDTLIENNYFEELELNRSHGEFTIDGTTLCTKTLLNVSYNTMLLTSGAIRSELGGGINTLMYLSGGNPKRSWTDVIASHNTLVANNLPNGDALASRIIELNYGHVFGSMEYSYNYMDPTGALFCYYVPSPNPKKTVFKGNKNLLDGSSVDDYSAEACHGHHR